MCRAHSEGHSVHTKIHNNTKAHKYKYANTNTVTTLDTHKHTFQGTRGPTPLFSSNHTPIPMINMIIMVIMIMITLVNKTIN